MSVRGVCLLLFFVSLLPFFAQAEQTVVIDSPADPCVRSLVRFGVAHSPNAPPKTAPSLINDQEAARSAINLSFQPDWAVVNSAPVFSIGRNSDGRRVFLVTDPRLAQEILKA